MPPWAAPSNRSANWRRTQKFLLYCHWRLESRLLSFFPNRKCKSAAECMRCSSRRTLPNAGACWYLAQERRPFMWVPRFLAENISLAIYGKGSCEKHVRISDLADQPVAAPAREAAPHARGRDPLSSRVEKKVAAEEFPWDTPFSSGCASRANNVNRRNDLRGT